MARSTHPLGHSSNCPTHSQSGDLALGDNLTLRVTQGTQAKFYDLKITGIADGRQYSLQPTIFVP
ncbi:MAG: hypothetical protein GYA59_08325, partial [Chloroflexi bacterium]|nr:hypothetical protein [Chloroflexota bacterium]